MTFWAIVIAALFIAVLVGLVVLGVRYYRTDKHASQRNTSRGEEQTHRSGSSGRSSSKSGGVHVYRH